jgi:predicted esterase
VAGRRPALAGQRSCTVSGQPDDVRPDDAGHRYPTWETLDAEIEAGIAALRARFPGRVADGPVLYAGFSQGANMGVAVMAKRPSMYRRAVLTEGGHWRWTAERARAYAAGGGERVLFACGRSSCVKEAAASVALLEAAGVEARIVAAEGAGTWPRAPWRPRRRARSRGCSKERCRRYSPSSVVGIS